MPTLTSPGLQFFASKISPNISKTPEGYLICSNCVIARTGFQKYAISEIADPDGMLGDRSPVEEIELWRDPTEVFRSETIASFEGKTLTLTHPIEMLGPDSEREHHVGHAQNVRVGTELLEDGNQALLADLLITDSQAIAAVQSGLRELSCGYSYTLAKTGERFDQTNIIGNHVALVDNARAGSEARINDSAKERRTMKLQDFLHRLGLNALISGADPKLVAFAKDAEIEPEERKEEEKKESKDRDCSDRRRKLHDALDKMLDTEFFEGPEGYVHPIRGSKGYSKKKAGDSEEREEEKDGKDVDIEELKDLLGDFFEEEKQEPEHQKDAEEEEEEEEGKEAGEKEPKDGAKDDEPIQPEPDLPPDERPESVFDAQFALKLMKSMRPIVARSKDPKLQKQFDTAMKAAKQAAGARTTGAGNGSYATFQRAASKAQDSWAKKTPAEAQAAQFDNVYATAGKQKAGRLPHSRVSK